MKKRIIALGMSLAVLMGFLVTGPIQVNADEVIQKEMSEDISEFSNTLENLQVNGTTCKSYLNKTDKGYREVLVNEQVHILDYDQKGNLLAEKILEFELPLFGGYYSGEKFNYLVFGQSGSSNGAEIYRIVKYDKEFNRINEVSVPYEDCYTVIPFYCGNVSIAESKNNLVVYTSRLRPDGHQSNIALRINSESMTIENIYGMVDFPDVHVSHSFRQIVKFDRDEAVYVDLSDGAPQRAVCLQQQAGFFTNMLDIEGEYGDNLTNTDVSGVEITDTGFLVVGTQMRGYCNNVYLSYAKRGEQKAQVIWLTNNTFYNYSDVCNAKIIEVADGIYAVMWNCYDNDGSVNYVMVNGQGELISGKKTLPGAELTQCEPILENGSVTWVRYIDGERDVFSLTDFTCTGTYEWEDTYVYPQDVWDGSEDTGWYQEGQETFTLNTPQQLAGFAKLVNNGNTFEGKKILIGKDMFFNEADIIKNVWTSIASTSSGISFEGTFDGQGHSLYNLFTVSGAEGGLFGMIGEKGIVKAVRVSQSFMCGASIAYQNNGWILFCENGSLVENVDTSCTAGICCNNKNLVYGCGNTGTIMGDDAAGIVGVNSEKVSTIDSCWNQGFVDGSGTVAGIVSSNFGWVYDCYNAGTVSGNFQVNYAKTVAGIVGGHHGSDGQIYNCYNTGHLDIDDDWTWYCNDTICGEGRASCKNIYSLPSKYNSATEITADELKSAEAITKLQGTKIIRKWCMDEDGLNHDYIIPTAQQDMENGIYKIFPDVWDPVTEVSINLEDGEYLLKGFSYAYYGIEDAKAVYSSDSNILSITSDGVITPLSQGTAVVTVTFEETEHTQEASFDVEVNIVSMRGDINCDGKVNMQDLMKCLHYISNRTTLSNKELAIADINEDNKVTITDLMRILHYLSGRSETL